MSKVRRILIADDQEANRELLQDILESFGYESELACDGIEAVAKVGMDIDLVLLDVVMPMMDGFETARQIREQTEWSDIPIIMVTALESKQDRLRAVAAGANDFVTKPIDKTELRVRMASLLKMKDMQDIVKQQKRNLEQVVERRTRALRHALERMVAAQRTIEEAHFDTIHRLAIAAEYKDHDTATHIFRIGEYFALLARRLHFSTKEVEMLSSASIMHDVGKIGIPDSILLKPGKLDAQEWQTMQQHTTIGARILHGSPSELLQAGEVIALTHHEKWDGSGYPRGLAGEDIPLWGRICAVVDVFDALTSERVYKSAFSNDAALDIMKKERGKHFDPNVLDLFLDRFDDVLAIQADNHIVVVEDEDGIPALTGS